MILAHGIEGEDYTLDENGIVTPFLDSNGILQTGNYSGVTGNYFNDYEEAPGKFEIIEGYMRRLLSSPLSGFKLDTTPISFELAQIDSLVTKYHDVLVTGAVSDWEGLYDEFLQRMKQVGSDKILAEIQSQIDAFTAVNEASVKENAAAFNAQFNAIQSRADGYPYDGFYVH